MTFFVAVIITIIVLSIIMPPPGGQPANKDGKVQCPPHKWEYNTEGHLYCTECKGKPGYSGRE